MELLSKTGFGLCFLNDPHKFPGKAVTPADDIDPHPMFAAGCQFADQIGPKEPQQAGDLRGRPFPVVAGKGIQSQSGDSRMGGRLDHAADRFRSGAVALMARCTALTSPAPVSIHDDGGVNSSDCRATSTL